MSILQVDRNQAIGTEARAARAASLSPKNNFPIPPVFV
jgi:hypothetical protein